MNEIYHEQVESVDSWETGAFPVRRYIRLVLSGNRPWGEFEVGEAILFEGQEYQVTHVHWERHPSNTWGAVELEARRLQRPGHPPLGTQQ